MTKGWWVLVAFEPFGALAAALKVAQPAEGDDGSHDIAHIILRVFKYLCIRAQDGGDGPGY